MFRRIKSPRIQRTAKFYKGQELEKLLTMKKSQNERAIELYQAGNIKEAFKLAKKFTMSFEPQDLLCIKKGYECLLRPDFYAQIGNDPDIAISEAKVTFENFMEKYLIRMADEEIKKTALTK